MPSWLSIVRSPQTNPEWSSAESGCTVAVGRFHFVAVDVVGIGPQAIGHSKAMLYPRLMPLRVVACSQKSPSADGHPADRGLVVVVLIFLAGDWIGGEGVGDCLIGGPYLTLGR